MLRNPLFAVVSLLLLSSCAGGWSGEFKKQFMDTCLVEANTWAISDEQANSFCDCRLGVVMTHYSTIEETIVNKDSVALREDLKQCDVAVGR